MKKFTHKDRPDFASYSEDEKVTLLNTLYDSELDLTDRCADLRDELSFSRSLINRLISLHEVAQDEISAYNHDLARLAKEIRERAQLSLPLDKEG